MLRAPAPWIRTRLTAAPGTACAVALLVAVTSCLAAALPRAVDRYDTGGLVRAVEQAGADRTTVQVYAPPHTDFSNPENWVRSARPESLGEQFRKILAEVRPPLVADPDRSTYGVRTTHPLDAPDTWLPRPGGIPPQLFLATRRDLAGHARTTAGRLPRTSGSVDTDATDVEAAVTTETAEALHVEAGSVLHIPRARGRALTVRITGIVAPRTPGGAYWSTEPVLRTPSLTRVPGGAPTDVRWVGALLVAPEAGPVLLGLYRAEPERYWWVAPDPDALRGRDLAGLTSAVAHLKAGPGLRRIRTAVDENVDTTTGLDEVLASHARLRSGVRPLLGVAAAGTGTVAAVVLATAGGLVADRRRTELALLRARGASLRGLAGRLLAETATVAVPAGALGLAVALRAVPGGRVAPALCAAAAVTALACLALPLHAVSDHRRVRVPTERQDATARRPSRRRTVAELTVLTLALGTVLTLRRQGGSAGGPAAAAAPVLVGVVAALLLARLYPLPLRGLARPARRLRGVIGHLALARAGRTSASTVLPLLALLAALTTAAFGGSVLAGVREARDQASVSAVGADARVEGSAGPLPGQLPDRMRHLPGVRDVTEVSLERDAQATDGRTSPALAGVDPARYAALADRTGLGAFPADWLSRPQDPAAPLPALASPTLEAAYGASPFSLRLGDGSVVTVRITAVRDHTPAVLGTDFLVVDRAGLSAAAARPTALLVTGDRLDAGALRRTVGAVPGAEVRLRSEERARPVRSPLQSGAETIYRAAVAAGAGYAVLALLLALLRAAPERTALLARLRTMGLTRRQSRHLLVLESLPQAALAAAGGTLTGWATVALLSPGVDLTVVALATSPAADAAALRTDPVSLLVPAVAVLTVSVVVAGLQAWWAGRKGAVRELRAGDAG
ncbi:ABC transporter permease [Streptomyces actuosus]|uniref:ABC transporter permease n=1 Tax=Streptomyces actuosus TaxID=1885 RepID=A0ABS2VTC1_STRAS|nr:FtsX-like permease family protein [Streptomyces actuosus]MBN0046374.1 ABC transporter permease [Streptomyces actuosus]